MTYNALLYSIGLLALFANSPLLAFQTDASQTTINVADHGIAPGEDVTFQLYHLITTLTNTPNVTLFFPKGQYEFYPENAREEHRAVANHDNSLKPMAMPLFDCKNITIDGGGSTFMFHGRISPIVLDGAQGATLKNFSIDWKRPFQSELKVVASDKKSAVVEIDREQFPYTVKGGEILFDHYDWQEPIGSNIVFDPNTEAPLHDTRQYHWKSWRPIKSTDLGENRVRIQAFCDTQPPVGSVVVTYGRNPTSRLAPAIHVANSRDVEIENVTVYAAGGMALIVERVENINLNRFKVTSTATRLVGPRADATHFIGCKGTVKLEDCLFEHMLDDGINVHGAYVKVAQHVGGSQFICEISHPQQWGLTFAAEGDKIALLSRTTILPFHETTVKKVTPLNERRFLIEVEDVPAQLPDEPLSMENLTWYPDVVMTNNVIRRNRARSALITTKGKVLIENNVFSSQMHGILIEGDNNKWYESGAVKDITIKNNVFENIGFGGGDRYPLLAAPLLTPEQHLGEGHYHRNINFTNNRIKSFNGRIAQARSVKGLNISGNQLEFSQDYPKDTKLPSIDLYYCDDVRINNNGATGFDDSLIVQQSDDTTNVRLSGNKGIATK